MTAPLVKKIEKLIAPMAESMGYEIVRVLLIGAGSGKPTLQVMAEKPDGTMPLDDCGRLSQAVSALLDVENVMGDGAYYLEVSSPGIDRPLTRLKDFERFQGKTLKIETEEAVDGRKRFKGTVAAVKGRNIHLDTEDGAMTVPFDIILKAKLSLDDLLPQPTPKKTNSKTKKTGSK